MQNDLRTHGLWEATSPPAPATELLRGHAAADVAVIGAGYTGLSVALHLSELGAAVSVVEAVDIGFGGSGRNAGFVNAGMWVQPNEILQALGAKYGERLLRTLSEAPKCVFDIVAKYQIQCDAENSGTLHCAVGHAGLREIEQRAAQWGARGDPVVLLDAEQTAAKVGTTVYAGSLWDLRAGTIQPLAYARGLAKAAIALGARIHTGEPVLSAERRGGGWVICTGGGSIAAPWVVVATDAYASRVWPEVRLQQIRLPYFHFATQPLNKALQESVLPAKHGIWDTKRVLSSARMDAEGRFIFGSIGALKGAGIKVHRAWAEREVQRIFPQIGKPNWESEWYGSIGMTADNMPRFHKLDANVIAVSGYNGRGIAPATALGRILAGYINGTTVECELPLPATPPREPRLRRWREIAYELGTGVVHALDARGGSS